MRIRALAAAEYVICFVEQAERVNGSVKEALERAACSRFNVPPSSVYVWQYNGQPLTGEHFIYLLNDIGKALACVATSHSFIECIICSCKRARNGCGLFLDVFIEWLPGLVVIMGPLFGRLPRFLESA
jgi:hypothetical protein